MLNVQRQVEETYSKRNINKWIKEDIGDIDNNTMFQSCVTAIREYRSKSYFASKDERISKIEKSDEEVAYTLFHVVCSVLYDVQPIQAMATKLGYAIGLEGLDAVKCGAEVLAVCKDFGVYEILHAFSDEHDHDTAVIKPLVRLESETITKIHMTMYLPPMVVAPRDWEDNRTGGYLLDENQGSCILGEGNHHSLNQALDVLNKLQSIKWSLNHDLLKEKELPKNPPEEGEIDPVELRKIEQHNQRCAQSDAVYEFALESGNEFFFVWKFDKRGRMYSQGYDINLQGSEYKKAILQFADAEYVTGVESIQQAA